MRRRDPSVSVSARLVTILVAFLSGSIILGLVLPAFADERDIEVGGVWVCRITHDASGYTSYQRAAEVRRRITEILSNPVYRKGGAVVEVHQTGNTATITVGGLLVFTLIPEDAMGEPVTPHVTLLVLAQTWARRLSDGLSRAFPDPNLHVF
jgi:hypothetical protein